MKNVILFSICLFGSLSVFAQKSLPNIHIIATGGTIAGVSSSSTSESYTPASIGVDQVVKSVPELTSLARITTEQPFSISSQDFTTKEWLELSKCVNRALEVDSIQGIVITHGTDVIEESAFWLALTTKSAKPIVLVGAMRPASSLSPDGPMNLFQAVAVAADSSAKNKGVMVVMNQKIYDPVNIIKSHTSDVESFIASNGGPMGRVSGKRVEFYYSDVLKMPYFDVEKCTELPKVAIVYGHAGFEFDVIESIAKAGYKGVVFAGVGNGNLPKSIIRPLMFMEANNMLLTVRSTRVFSGAVAEEGEDNGNFICSRGLSPQKARVLLMLALTSDYNRTQNDGQKFVVDKFFSEF